MFIRKKCKNIAYTMRIVCLLLLCVLGIVLPESVSAAPNASSSASTSGEETMEYLPLQSGGKTAAIGRYQFNYTGNWNYFSNFNAITGMEEEAVRNTIIPGYINSSRATLTNTSGADGIVKAYLIWETRAPYEQWNESVNHVRFINGNGAGWNIYPDFFVRMNVEKMHFVVYAVLGNTEKALDMLSEVVIRDSAIRNDFW